MDFSCKYIYIYIHSLKSLDRNLRGILKKFFLRNFILEKVLFLKKKTERLATKIGFAVCNCSTFGGGGLTSRLKSFHSVELRIYVYNTKRHVHHFPSPLLPKKNKIK